MSDLYKLVFRGEVLDGQHPAVVRKRLGEAGGFDAAALEKLFSGRPVILKREADKATAARLQALFRKAGARLRVHPADAAEGAGRADAAESAGPAARDGRAERMPAAGSPVAAGGFELLPAGADVLRDDERRPFEPLEVDTGDLALEKTRFVTDDAAPPPPGPDVSHLTLAEVGAPLAPSRDEPVHVVQAPALEVAAVGADLAPRAAPPAAPVDFTRLSFEVAPAGADLDQRQPAPPPAAPDTSHLSTTP